MPPFAAFDCHLAHHLRLQAEVAIACGVAAVHAQGQEVDKLRAMVAARLSRERTDAAAGRQLPLLRAWEVRARIGALLRFGFEGDGVCLLCVEWKPRAPWPLVARL